MKGEKIILLCTFLFSNYFFSQVGIGTSNINSNIILQVNSSPHLESKVKGGILFPRIALTATNDFAPIIGTATTGLTVYNTASNGKGDTAVIPGFYFWDNTKLLWVRIAQENTNETALFSNQDTGTNLNSGSSYADVFANIRFNSDSTLYQKLNNTTLQINKVGYYKVILNLDLTNGSGTSDNFGVEVEVNKSSSIVSDRYYIPGRATSDASVGKSFVIYVPVNIAGHSLRIRAFELDPGTRVYFKNPNTSTISIEKLR
ncbi:hypothetical protein [Chryseobacterium sp.]|uniref:hypothetical protein n=1 Tax=Chryseobacterium sp. TaxID=1871047 RepID=UPI00289CE2CC|nr:hypothetical protein [Chryseobacterium sp.]